MLWRGTNIRIYRDNLCKVSINEIINNLSKRFTTLKFVEGASNFVLTDSNSCTPLHSKQLLYAIDRETTGDDIVFVFTEKPYLCNLFWEIYGRKVIISFYGWDCHTTLPKNNGVVFFICSIILYDIVGERHQHNTSCVMDYWWHQGGINDSLRASYVCPKCLENLHKAADPWRQKTIEETVNVLHDLRIASKSGIDVCHYWRLRSRS